MCKHAKEKVPSSISVNQSMEGSDQVGLSSSDSPQKQKRTRSAATIQDLQSTFLKRRSPQKCAKGSQNNDLDLPKGSKSRCKSCSELSADVCDSQETQSKSHLTLNQLNGEVPGSKGEKKPTDCLVKLHPGPQKSPRRKEKATSSMSTNQSMEGCNQIESNTCVSTQKQKRTRSLANTQEVPQSTSPKRRSPRKCANGSQNGELDPSNSSKSPVSRISDCNSELDGEVTRCKAEKVTSCLVKIHSPGTRKSPRRCINGGQDGSASGCKGNGVAAFTKSPLRKLSDQFLQKPVWNPRDPSQIHALKEALQVSVAPSHLVCREEEQKKIFEFCCDCLEKKKGGSLYVCGCPGTGKTLFMGKVKEKLVAWAKDEGFTPPDILDVNCTRLPNASEIFNKINEKYQAQKKVRQCGLPLQHLQNLFSENKLHSVGNMLLLIVDEMDYLITKDNTVLHELFMLTKLPFSKFILVGISNSIDLADRFLPKLQALNCKPLTVTFPAYSKEQILGILQQRLMVIPAETFQPQALELCARRVAAASGDMRKALSICSSAVQLLQADLVGSSLDLNLSEDSSSSKPVAPGDKLINQEMDMVRFEHMAVALSKTFKSVIVDTILSLPQHQQIILCSMVKLFRGGKKTTTVGELNASYSDMCKSVQVPPVNMLEFSNLCRVLTDQGIIELGSSRQDKSKKIKLKADEADITFALQELFHASWMHADAPHPPPDSLPVGFSKRHIVRAFDILGLVRFERQIWFSAMRIQEKAQAFAILECGSVLQRSAEASHTAKAFI